ncbi:MAG: peptidylprolyl isomerase [Deltaproteobacteria bacterium]|nr:MAG: peptidylprolyl isomerase [Deltaproteobacteria bacterium]
MKIEDGRRVRIQCKLSVAGGDLIEESEVEFIQGAGTVIPGLEKALAGLDAGASKSGVIPADEAFSAVDHLPPKHIPRAEFPADATLAVGETFVAKGPHGEDVTFRVERVGDDDVEVRFVHPLAGKDIAYDVTVLSVTDPLPPPLPGDALPEADD